MKMAHLKSYKLFEQESNEVDLSDELTELTKDLSNIGKDIQKELGEIAKKDSELVKKAKETNQNSEDEINEGVALGIILSSGAIIELVGKLMEFLGKTFDKNDVTRLREIGKVIETHGHKIHHKLLKLITLMLKPFIFWLPKEKQLVVANVAFMAILAFKVSSGSIDPSDYKNMSTFVEGLLNGLKASEIGVFLKDIATALIDLAKSI